MIGGQIAEDWQIWKGDEGGVHFMLTKEVVPVPNGPTIYMLSVSGSLVGKERVISDFISAFGEPMNRFKILELTGLNYVSWNAKTVDEGRK